MAGTRSLARLGAVAVAVVAATVVTSLPVEGAPAGKRELSALDQVVLETLQQVAPHVLDDDIPPSQVEAVAPVDNFTGELSYDWLGVTARYKNFDLMGDSLLLGQLVDGPYACGSHDGYQVVCGPGDDGTQFQTGLYGRGVQLDGLGLAMTSGHDLEVVFGGANAGTPVFTNPAFTDAFEALNCFEGVRVPGGGDPTVFGQTYDGVGLPAIETGSRFLIGGDVALLLQSPTGDCAHPEAYRWFAFQARNGVRAPGEVSTYFIPRHPEVRGLSVDVTQLLQAPVVPPEPDPPVVEPPIDPPIVDPGPDIVAIAEPDDDDRLWLALAGVGTAGTAVGIWLVWPECCLCYYCRRCRRRWRGDDARDGDLGGLDDIDPDDVPGSRDDGLGSLEPRRFRFKGRFRF